MPAVPIPINKGRNSNVDSFALGNSEYAEEFKNLLLDDAGANVDRPARTQFATISAFPVEGVAFFNDSLVAVTSHDRKIWQIDSVGGVTDITGTALAGGSRPVFATDGTYLAIAGGGAPRRWDGSGDTELMPGSPESCSHISYLDGYWITHLLNDQEFRIAGPTSATRDTWDANSFFQAERYPDNLVSQAVLSRELYGFGSSSTEIFQNFGDSDTPFQPVFATDWGCLAPYSVVNFNNTLGWLAQTAQGDRQFVMLQGRTPVVISTAFDRELQALETVDDCWGVKIDIEGFHLVTWTFPTEKRTFTFQYNKGEWSEWDGFQDGSTNRFRMHSYCYAPAWNKHFIGDPINGTIWQLSRDNKADGSDVLRRLRRTGTYDHGTGKRKRNNSYEFNVKRGLGVAGGTEPKLIVRFKDDDKEWSEPREIFLGYSGNRASQYRLYRTGIYRKRQIEISMTDAVEFNLAGITEDVDVLAS